MDHNRQKKAAVINDYSSFGRCSLAVAAPILAALKVQCCPVPTAMFTNHTGFEHFSWHDCTDRMDAYIADWQATGLQFAAIQSGFLASLSQLDYVKRFVAAFRDGSPLVLVDPVMGDYGRLYRTFKPEVAEGLRGLLDVADVLTPNLTEACILADVPYRTDMSDREVFDLARRLCEPHARAAVVSGIPRGGDLVNFVYSREHGEDLVPVPRIGVDRSGTGDVFSTVILGELLNGRTMADSVRRAADFVAASVRRAAALGIPPTDGLPIEETLSLLWS